MRCRDEMGQTQKGEADADADADTEAVRRGRPTRLALEGASSNGRGGRGEREHRGEVW